jgi:hypothetical protein
MTCSLSILSFFTISFFPQSILTVQNLLYLVLGYLLPRILSFWVLAVENAEHSSRNKSSRWKSQEPHDDIPNRSDEEENSYNDINSINYTNKKPKTIQLTKSETKEKLKKQLKFCSVAAGKKNPKNPERKVHFGTPPQS